LCRVVADGSHHRLLADTDVHIPCVALPPMLLVIVRTTLLLFASGLGNAHANEASGRFSRKKPKLS
jgi:hypothetical protein